jgi:tRNA threonylcarbamoyladenosine biosynthesis protein TsaB
MGSVAVSGVDGQLHTLQLDPGKPHSQTLLPGIEDVLARAGLYRRDVEIIAAGVGPGAFTGLRVGLATLKGWASAASIPMVPVDSLDAVALPVLKEGSATMVAVDARKGELYVAFYSGMDENGIPVLQGEIELLPVSEAVDVINNLAGTRAFRLVGTGATLLAGAGIGSSFIAGDESEQLPLASDILAIASVKVQLDGTVEAGAIVPRYVRPPDAKPPSPGAIITPDGTRATGPGSRDDES